GRDPAWPNPPACLALCLRRPGGDAYVLGVVERAGSANALLDNRAFELGVTTCEPFMSRALLAYCRVSTKAQGRSGFGLEAQREALARFVAAEGFEIVREFIEIETGKGADALDRRPQLAAALAEARRRRCPVAVAKLDRLSRDVHFISGLMAERVRRACGE